MLEDISTIDYFIFQWILSESMNIELFIIYQAKKSIRNLKINLIHFKKDKSNKSFEKINLINPKKISPGSPSYETLRHSRLIYSERVPKALLPKSASSSKI